MTDRRFREVAQLEKRNQSAETTKQRKLLADKIRILRRSILSNENKKTYGLNRTFQQILTDERVNLRQIIKGFLLPTGQTRILDSGAGHYGLTQDIKQTFLQRVHITTLDVMLPKTAQPPVDMYRKALNNLQRKIDEGMPSSIASAERKFIDDALNSREKMAQQSKSADHIRVSSAERFKTKTKFHIILDIFGPLYHSKFPEEVVQSYHAALEENGVIITNNISSHTICVDCQEVYTDPLTRRKYLFERTPLDEKKVFWEVRKVRASWLE